MNKRQEAVYHFIVDYFREHHSAPTMREIIENSEYTSTSSVSHCLNALAREGLIENISSGVKGNRARSMRVVGALWLSPEDADICTYTWERTGESVT